MIRVLLVDDQPLVREGLRRIFDLVDDLTVVGECTDGDEVVEAVARCRPDVVLMDVRMKRVDGSEATRRLRDLDGAAPPVLILTTYDDDETVAAALGAGASGFVLKDAPAEDLVRAATTVAGGEAWLDPGVASRVLARWRVDRPGPPPDPRLADLSPREGEVLRLVGRGATNREIAEALAVSEATVKSHVGSIFAKLGLRDRAAAIVFAFDHGLVEPGG